MTRHNNILSFDEARARGAVSSFWCKASAKISPIAHKNAAHSSQMRRSASQLNPQRPVLNQARQSSAHASSSRPERLTYDPSFAQSFTATARSGSYQNARRGERSVHPRMLRICQPPRCHCAIPLLLMQGVRAQWLIVPFALAILMLVRMQRVHKMCIAPIQRRMRSQRQEEVARASRAFGKSGASVQQDLRHRRAGKTRTRTKQSPSTLRDEDGQDA